MQGTFGMEDGETPVAVHAVQHLIHAWEHLPGWRNAGCGSRIVSGIQGLPRDAVERSLQAFHRLGAHGGKDRR